MIEISPYLTFNGNCRDAMTFYHECFGGELTLQTVAETPIADQCPASMQDQIMHAAIVNDGFVLMATDMTRSGEEFAPGNDMALSLDFGSEEELNKCYSNLADEGNILDSLERKSWGAIFGVVQDKFGKVWMLNYEKDES